MNQDFRQHYISTVAAALVAALPTGKRTKPQTAAALDVDDDYDRIETVPRKGHGQIDKSLVSNIVAAEMMRMQK
jgi:hypothetical protein